MSTNISWAKDKVANMDGRECTAVLSVMGKSGAGRLTVLRQRIIAHLEKNPSDVMYLLDPTDSLAICCVNNCNQVGGFLFPCEPGMTEEWLLGLGMRRFQPNPDSVVCRKHFLEEDVLSVNKNGKPMAKIKLARGALPRVIQLIPRNVSPMLILWKRSRVMNEETGFKIMFQQRTPNPPFVVHPDVQFKPLPFYQVIAELIKPSTLSTSSSAMVLNSSFDFHLTPQQANLIKSNVSGPTEYNIFKEFAVQVQVRFCLLETTSAQSDNYPPDLKVHVNRSMLELPAQPKNNPGNYQPLDITRFIQIDPYSSNSIAVSHVASYLRFVIAVYLVRKETATKLLSNLKSKALRVSYYTKGMIQQKLNADLENEIATTCLRVSLVCPLGKMRMKNPCRAKTCDHVQCFDVDSYLQMNEKRPGWLCPVCHKPAAYEDLHIDEYFLKVLTSPLLPSDCSEIQLLNDGEWRPFGVTKTTVTTKKTAAVEVSLSDEEIEVLDVKEAPVARKARSPDLEVIDIRSTSPSPERDLSPKPSQSQTPSLPFKKRITTTQAAPDDGANARESPAVINLDSDSSSGEEVPVPSPSPLTSGSTTTPSPILDSDDSKSSRSRSASPQPRFRQTRRKQCLPTRRSRKSSRFQKPLLLTSSSSDEDEEKPETPRPNRWDIDAFQPIDPQPTSYCINKEKSSTTTLVLSLSKVNSASSGDDSRKAPDRLINPNYQNEEPDCDVSSLVQAILTNLENEDVAPDSNTVDQNPNIPLEQDSIVLLDVAKELSVMEVDSTMEEPKESVIVESGKSSVIVADCSTGDGSVIVSPGAPSKEKNETPDSSFVESEMVVNFDLSDDLADAVEAAHQLVSIANDSSRNMSVLELPTSTDCNHESSVVEEKNVTNDLQQSESVAVESSVLVGNDSGVEAAADVPYENSDTKTIHAEEPEDLSAKSPLKIDDVEKDLNIDPPVARDYFDDIKAPLQCDENMSPSFISQSDEYFVSSALINPKLSEEAPEIAEPESDSSSRSPSLLSHGGGSFVPAILKKVKQKTEQSVGSDSSSHEGESSVRKAKQKAQQAITDTVESDSSSRSPSLVSHGGGSFVPAILKRVNQKTEQSVGSYSSSHEGESSVRKAEQKAQQAIADTVESDSSSRSPSLVSHGGGSFVPAILRKSKQKTEQAAGSVDSDSSLHGDESSVRKGKLKAEPSAAEPVDSDLSSNGGESSGSTGKPKAEQSAAESADSESSSHGGESSGSQGKQKSEQADSDSSSRSPSLVSQGGESFVPAILKKAKKKAEQDIKETVDSSRRAETSVRKAKQKAQQAIAESIDSDDSSRSSSFGPYDSESFVPAILKRGNHKVEHTSSDSVDSYSSASSSDVLGKGKRKAEETSDSEAGFGTNVADAVFEWELNSAPNEEFALDDSGRRRKRQKFRNPMANLPDDRPFVPSILRKAELQAKKEKSKRLNTDEDRSAAKKKARTVGVMSQRQAISMRVKDVKSVAVGSQEKGKMKNIDAVEVNSFTQLLRIKEDFSQPPPIFRSQRVWEHSMEREMEEMDGSSLHQNMAVSNSADAYNPVLEGKKNRANCKELKDRLRIIEIPEIVPGSLNQTKKEQLQSMDFEVPEIIPRSKIVRKKKKSSVRINFNRELIFTDLRARKNEWPEPHLTPTLCKTVALMNKEDCGLPDRSSYDRPSTSQTSQTTRVDFDHIAGQTIDGGAKSHSEGKQISNSMPEWGDFVKLPSRSELKVVIQGDKKEKSKKVKQDSHLPAILRRQNKPK